MTPDAPVRPRARHGRHGLTLIEVIISVAVFALLALAMLIVSIPMTRSTTGATLGLEMDREARALFALLRRDLRPSGYDGSTANFSLDPNTAPLDTSSYGGTRPAVTFDLDRSGAIDAAKETFRPDLACRKRTDISTWGPWVVYNTTNDPTTGRLLVRRSVVSGTTLVQPVDVIKNVKHFLVRQDAGSLTIHVVLVLERIDAYETDPDPKKRLVQRVYEDRVQLMNPVGS